MINTPASQLKDILTESDSLTVSSSNELIIDGCSAKELIEQYGSPLYVYSESTLRANINRARSAWERAWPQPINIMYAIKTLTNVAIRAVANDEGCGGDCFGAGELYATFKGGADASKIVLNGSIKQDDDIREAIERGVCINMDSEQEVAQVHRLATELGKTARVAIRLKLTNDYLDTFQGDNFPTDKASYREEMSWWKWGMNEQATQRMLAELAEYDNLEFIGYHAHCGRSGREIEWYTEWNRSYAKFVAYIYKETGVAPKMMDLGGGWARERDPETLDKATMMNPHSAEDYAKSVCEAIRAELEAVDMPLPELWLEMGRYLSGNTGMLLTTVELIKEDPEAGRSWTHVDAHTFLLPYIEMFHSPNPVIFANDMDREFTGVTNIVGPHCITGNWKEHARVPDVKIGDLVCVLDGGMYGEQIANHFNSMPIPASVLVNHGQSDLIKRRETLEDIFGLQQIPERLRK